MDEKQPLSPQSTPHQSNEAPLTVQAASPNKSRPLSASKIPTLKARREKEHSEPSPVIIQTNAQELKQQDPAEEQAGEEEKEELLVETGVAESDEEEEKKTGMNDTLRWDAPGAGLLLGEELPPPSRPDSGQPKKRFGKCGGKKMMKFGKQRSERSLSISSSGSDKISFRKGGRDSSVNSEDPFHVMTRHLISSDEEGETVNMASLRKTFYQKKKIEPIPESRPKRSVEERRAENESQKRASLVRLTANEMMHVYQCLNWFEIMRVSQVSHRLRENSYKLIIWQTVYARFPQQLLPFSNHRLPKLRANAAAVKEVGKEEEREEDEYTALEKEVGREERARFALNVRTFFNSTYAHTNYSSGEGYKQNFMEEVGMRGNIKKARYQLFHLKGHKGDLKALHSVGHEVVSGGADSNVMYWNLEKKQQLCLQGHYNTIQTVHLYPQLKRIISSGGDHHVRVWEYGKKKYEELGKKNFITKINGVSQLGERKALSYGNFSKISLWDVESASIVCTFEDDTPHTERCASAGNSAEFFVSTDQKVVKLWDVEKGKVILQVGESEWKPEIQKPNRVYEITAMCYSAQNLLFTGERRRIRLWDLREPVHKHRAVLDIPLQLTAHSTEQDEEVKEESMVVQAVEDIKWREYYYEIGTWPIDIRFIEAYNMVLSRAETSPFITLYDIRRPYRLVNYKTHHYHTTSVDTGKTLLTSHLAAVSGKYRGNVYCLRLLNLLKDEREQPFEKVVHPGQNNAIMKIFMGDEVIVTGARNGGLTAVDFKLTRKYLSNRPIILKNVPGFKNI